jgi:hypothetical protein
MVISRKTEHVIQDRDGKIQRRNSYGNDPVVAGMIVDQFVAETTLSASRNWPKHRSAPLWLVDPRVEPSATPHRASRTPEAASTLL